MTKRKLVVACRNAEGAPDMVVVEVEASDEGVANGDHYESAQERAEELGYEAPFICFDEQEWSPVAAVCRELRLLG